jgi:DsbC/DsbD-like thiol-disulfide interchange protein
MFRAMRQARPDAWLAAVVVACFFAGGSEQRSTTVNQPRKAADVVQVRSAATAIDPDGNQRVMLTLDIRPDWHIYANPVGCDAAADSATVVTFRAGDQEESADMDYPPGARSGDAALGDCKIYEGRVTVAATVKRTKPDAPLTAVLKVQACNKDRKCLAPGTIVVPVP